MHPEEIREGNSGHDQDHQLRLLQTRKGLLNFFGERNQGRLVLDIIVRISITTLMSYPGEKDLQVALTEIYSLAFIDVSLIFRHFFFFA